jgi:UDP:flavonoid glycosyltransferase YjiC (YdhE family)
MGRMRFLFSFAGGSGHFFPTEVFARVLAGRGHDIRYTCQEAMAATVAAAGWRVAPSGGASLLSSDARRPLVPADRQAEERAVRNFFAGRGARERAHRVVDVLERWRPDLVVRDEMDFGAAVAADVLGLPHAAVAVIAAGGLAREDVIGEPLSALRSEFGLVPQVAVQALNRYLLVVPVPPRFRDPRDPPPSTARYVRPAIFEDLEGTAPGRPSGSESREPHVYLTLGTIFPQESGDLFQRALAGLVSLGARVTVTTGGAITAAELGDQPSSVRVEPFLPLSEVLTDSDLVVSHAGSGTVVSALALGRPQVLLPMGADQLNTAERCEQLGVGIALDSFRCTPDDVAHAVGTVLRTPAFRSNAERLAEEARALPDAGYGASLLEAVAQAGRPITDLGRDPGAGVPSAELLEQPLWAQGNLEAPGPAGPVTR